MVGINFASLLSANLQYMNQMQRAQQSMIVSSERLSTGKAINRAADSPSDILRINRFEAQVRGNVVGSKNIQDGISYLQVKDKALEGAQSVSQRLRELAVKYENGSLSTEDKQMIEQEAKDLTKELSYLLNETKFNGQSVFSGEDKRIQAGANPSDTVILSKSTFGAVGRIDDFQEVEVVSDIYDFSIRLSDGSAITGELKLDMKEGSNQHSFEIVNGDERYQGTLSFVNDDKALFSLNTNGIRYEGELYLNQQSSSKYLEGNNSYKVTRVTLDENVLDEISNQNEVPNKSNESSSQFPFWGLNLPGINISLGSWKKRKESSESNNTVEVKKPNEWFQDVSLNGNVSFSLQSQETRTEIVNKGKDVSLKDIENMDVSTILNTNFIDKHILNPLAKHRTTVGIEENTLSSRLDFINDLTALQSKTLSQIADVDFAKEIMNQIKQEMLLNTNINLFQNNSYQYRQHIVQLLQ